VAAWELVAVGEPDVAAPNLSRIDQRLKNLIRNLPYAARQYNFQYRVTSGFRSRATQQKLYNEYISGRATYPVAVPGTSAHEKGLALDILTTDLQKMVPLLTSSGLYWGGPADPIHFSLVPGEAAISSRTNELPAAKETFAQSFYNSSKTILGLASWIPSPIGLVATIADWFS
jgi:hypothetical protein